MPKPWPAVLGRTWGVWWRQGGICCVCFWAVGSAWAPCQAGLIAGVLPLPHHLLAICLRKSSSLLCCRRQCLRGADRALPSSAAFSLSPRRASGPVSSHLKAGPRLSAPSSSPVTSKGPVRGFSEGTQRMQFGLGSGCILNQSNVGSLSERPRVDGNCEARSHCRLWSAFSVPGLTLSFISRIMCVTPLQDWYGCYYPHSYREGRQTWKVRCCTHDRTAVSGTGTAEPDIQSKASAGNRDAMLGTYPAPLKTRALQLGWSECTC